MRPIHGSAATGAGGLRFATPHVRPNWTPNTRSWPVHDGMNFTPSWLWSLGRDAAPVYPFKGGACAVCTAQQELDTDREVHVRSNMS